MVRPFYNPLFHMLLALVSGVFLATTAALADEPHPAPKTGLLWVRSALPSVFPLQVKTAPGRDYHLTLTDTQTQDKTLAAYIRGGDFFRVLVPPGVYTLRFAYGARWQGQTRLFGDATRIYHVEESLRFATRGIGTKAGHLVDLRGLIETREVRLTTPLSICQIERVVFEEIAGTTSDAGFHTAFRHTPGALDRPRLIPRHYVYSRICD